MKKRLTVFALFLIMLTSLFVLSGCGGKSGHGFLNRDHVWLKGVIVREPTCTTDGLMTQECRDCDDEVLETVLPAKGHTFGEPTVISKPTCLIEGISLRVCEVCGYEEESVLAKVGHDYEVTENVAPTCTSSGYTAYSCKVCGSGYVDNKARLEHDFDSIVFTQEATCLTAGYRVYACANCGERRSEVIEPTGHSYNEGVISVPAACETAGKKIRTCEKCGDSITVNVPATGHKVETVGTYVPATCKQYGITAGARCSVCDKVFEEQTLIEKTSHSYHLGVCLYCGDEQTFYVNFMSKAGLLVRAVPFTVSSYDIDEPAVPEIEGYTDGRWEKYSLSADDIYVHPLYTPIRYVITYSGLAGGTHDNPTEYTIESDFELSDAELPGYVFDGWFSGSGRVRRITEGSTGSLELEARWDLAHYSITYENTKTADVSGLVSSYTIDDETITLPELSAEYFTFNGWLNEKGERITEIPKGSYGDLVIRADFTAERFTVEYNNLSGGRNENPEWYTVETPTIILKPAERDGYTFDGWYSNGGEVTQIELGSHENYTLEAKWHITVYTITYGEVYGVDTESLPKTYTIETEVTLPSIFIRGYTFNGWILNGRAIKKIEKGSFGNIELTASLTPNKYTLTLDPAGGTVSKTSVEVSYNSEYDLPVPVREGSKFLGWFDNSGTSGAMCADENGKSVAEYDSFYGKVLYAHWDTLTFTVTYDDGRGGEPTARTYEYGAPFVSFEPSGDGVSKFDGWYSLDYAVKYTESTTVTEDFTVYARWIESIAITDAQGVIDMANDPSKNYHLENDINMRGAVWTPIDEFTGTLNGNGYSIKNLIMSNTAATECFAFIKVNRGTIENLGFSDVNFTLSYTLGQSSVGGVFVGVNYGTVYGCKLLTGSVQVTVSLISNTREDITWSYSFGAIVGSNTAEGTVDSCSQSVNATVGVSSISTLSTYAWNCPKTLNASIGGVVGSNNGTVTNCDSTGTFTASITSRGNGGSPNHEALAFLFISGLVGRNADGGTVTKSYSDVNINVTDHRESLGHTYCYAGGLVGWNDAKAVVEQSFSIGSISGGAYDEVNFGGFVGRNSGEARISSCYSKVNVSAAAAADCGGFVGHNQALIRNCYSTGSVSSDKTVNIGGFVGRTTDSSNISMSYSTGDVNAVSGSAGFFVGNNAGSVYKCYYLQGARVMFNGEYLTRLTEYGTIEGQSYNRLWNEEFLVGEMYWDEEGWIILMNEDPILDWETSLSHDYETTIVEPTCDDFGFTVYVCRDCSRIFIRTFVQPLGHEYGEPVYHDPTCTDEGYTAYPCLRDGCGAERREDIIDALGHTESSVVEESEPTCTDGGYTVYHCDVCENDFRVTHEAKGHNPTVLEGDERVEPQCRFAGGEDNSIAGRTAKITCADCGEVLEDSKVIEPHSFNVEVKTAASCTQEGHEKRTCRICGYVVEDAIVPKLEHKIIDGTARCGLCGAYVVDESTIIKISSADGLKAIANNLNGVYMLTANVNLEGKEWKPLGVFRGILFGNNFRISNLNLGGASGGLFTENRGQIIGLTIENVTAALENADGAVVGAIAARNFGQIQNCTLVGTISFSTVSSTSVNDFAEHSFTSVNTFGGFVGENKAGATVTGCASNAAIEVTAYNYCVNTADVDVWYYTYRGWHLATAESRLTLNFGAIAGVNEGKIADCSANGASAVRYTQSANVVREKGGIFGVTYWAGKVQVTLNLYAGALVGLNTGTVSSCTGRTITVSDNGSTSDEANAVSERKHVERHVWTDDYDGLVGANLGYGTSENVNEI